MASSKNSWDNHYNRNKSVLKYPDENLVRMLNSYISTVNSISDFNVFDLGCGSGRHLKLLNELGFNNIIGFDMAYNALKICYDNYPINVVQCLNNAIPCKNNSFEAGICWGGLHYTTKDNFLLQVSEIFRILKNNGIFFGTLRSDHDTFLKKGKHCGNNTWITNLSDIENSTVSFYSEDELKSAFKSFSSLEYGLMERTSLGNINNRISHWYFKAVK